jgi:hypothetical protein
MGRTYSLIGHVYHMTGNDKEALGYFHTALDLLEASQEYPDVSLEVERRKYFLFSQRS